MKNLTEKIVIVVGFALMLSCQKVIDIPLNEVDREIVIEAIGRNYLDESYILLSKSGSVYDDSEFEKLSDAVVTITDKEGIETVFSEDPLEKGKYLSSSFLASPKNNYSLNISYKEQLITAQSTTNSFTALDSLSYMMHTGGGFGPNVPDTVFQIFYHFFDNGDETNFYRVKIWINGKADENYYIGNDVLGNGQPVSGPLFATLVEPKDTVFVELLSMDEATYTYLFTLSSNINSSGPFGATPANPVSNLDSGIGYFGVFIVDTLTIIMP